MACYVKVTCFPAPPGPWIRFNTECAQIFNLPLPWGFLVITCLSKTIQLREMVVHLPLPLIPWPALCPATAITRALSFTSKASPGSQKFLPTLCFYSNFALYFAPWTCQPQIMQAILSVGVGLPLLFKPGFRWNSSRYSATGFWTPFAFILGFHSLSHFNQLISLLRLLFHTTPLNSTLGLER